MDRQQLSLPGLIMPEGDIVVMMDADLQNDPVDIPIMVTKIDEGYDVVSGWRHERKDKFLTTGLTFKDRKWLDFLGHRCAPA